MFYYKFAPSFSFEVLLFGDGYMGDLGDNIFILKFSLKQDGLSL